MVTLVPPSGFSSGAGKGLPEAENVVIGPEIGDLSAIFAKIFTGDFALLRR